MVIDQLRRLVETALEQAQTDRSLPSFALPPVEIARPKQAGHGDYSSNIALVAASLIRKESGENVNPRRLAEVIVDHLVSGVLVGDVELAGPGFVNFWLADSWLQQQVPAIIAAGEHFGDIDRGRGERWQVEYVSANPAGPIHYGGARNAVLGDSLANVLEAAGYNVQREFYVNDYGTQFGLFIETLYARYAQLFDQAVPLPENGYPGEYMIDYARQVADKMGDHLLQLERQNALDELHPLARSIVLGELETELKRIGVVFDRWFSEQSLYDEGLVEEGLAYLDKKGELVKRDGAVWFLASRYPKNDKDEVVIRSNGLPTYLAGDIAYHYDKFFRRKFDRVVNVWSVDHQGHVPRHGGNHAGIWTRSGSVDHLDVRSRQAHSRRQRSETEQTRRQLAHDQRRR